MARRDCRGLSSAAKTAPQRHTATDLHILVFCSPRQGWRGASPFPPLGGKRDTFGSGLDSGRPVAHCEARPRFRFRVRRLLFLKRKKLCKCGRSIVLLALCKRLRLSARCSSFSSFSPGWMQYALIALASLMVVPLTPTPNVLQLKLFPRMPR